MRDNTELFQEEIDEIREYAELDMEVFEEVLECSRGVISKLGEEDEKDKLLVRPGISGYTQAYYRNSISVREKRLYDAWYAHNVTMWLDIKILFIKNPPFIW